MRRRHWQRIRYPPKSHQRGEAEPQRRYPVDRARLVDFLAQVPHQFLQGRCSVRPGQDLPVKRSSPACRVRSRWWLSQLAALLSCAQGESRRYSS